MNVIWESKPDSLQHYIDTVHNGNKTHAARALGVSAPTIYNRLARPDETLVIDGRLWTTLSEKRGKV